MPWAGGKHDLQSGVTFVISCAKPARSGSLEILIPIGAVISLIGLAGLVVCIFRAAKIRKSGGTSDEVTAKFQSLVALNMGSLFVSVIGLICVVIGILLS